MQRSCAFLLRSLLTILAAFCFFLVAPPYIEGVFIAAEMQSQVSLLTTVALQSIIKSQAHIDYSRWRFYQE